MRHGTASCYAFNKCRCDPCRSANTVYSKRRRLVIIQGGSLTVPSLGSVRRIQALRRLGWTLQHIADEAGWGSFQAVERVTRRQRVSVSTADRLNDVYERLGMTLGPSVPGRRQAERLGYLPPLAWDDIDDPDESPAPSGERTNYLAADLLSEVAFLTSCGESIEQAARQLGVSIDAIEKAGERVRARGAA